MVLCVSQVIHLVPMILYLFAYCVLLLLSLVGIAMFDCSQILQIYECKLIGGYQFLISWVYSDLFLIALVIYPTFGGRSIYLSCIVFLWNGFWTSGFISLHCLPCDYLGGPNGNWYPCLTFPFSTLLMLWCPWNEIICSICRFLIL